MAIAGNKSANLASATLADDILVNRGGSTRRMQVGHLSAQLGAISGPTYETRAQLYADLAWAAGSIGKVVGDATLAYRGLFKKSGASGGGAWARIGPLPEADAEGLAAQVADHAARLDGIDATLSTETSNRQSADEALVARYARSAIGANRAAERQGFFSGGLLDVLPPAWAVYGFQRLLSAYDGPILRGRHTQGGAEFDVYAGPAGKATLGSIASDFLDWNDSIRLKTLYDVSGNGRHATADSVNDPQFFARQGDASAVRTTGVSRLVVEGSGAITQNLAGLTIGLLVHAPATLPAGQVTCILIPGTGSSYRAAVVMTPEGRIDLQVLAYGAGVYVTVQGATVTAADGWQAVVASIDFAAGVARLWQNGQVYSAPIAAGTLPNAADSNVLLFNHTGNAAFPGPIAGFTIHRQALSPILQGVLGDLLRAAGPNSAYAKRLARVAYMTDLHCSPSKAPSGTRVFADSPAKIAAAMATFATLDPPADLLVIGGDMIDGRNASGDLEDCALVKTLITDVWAGARPPIYVLGNHDFSNYVPRAAIIAALGSARQPYGSMDFGGLHIVWLDTNYREDDDAAHYDTAGASSAAYVPPAQRDWLEADLGATSRPVVIFAHHPVDDPLSSVALRNPAAVRDVITRSGAQVLAIVTGHSHANGRRLYAGLPVYRMAGLVEGEISAAKNAYAVIDVYENRIVIRGYADQLDHNVETKITSN